MALHFTNLHPICLVSASSTPVPSVAAQLHLGSETKKNLEMSTHETIQKGTIIHTHDFTTDLDSHVEPKKINLIPSRFPSRSGFSIGKKVIDSAHQGLAGAVPGCHATR